MCVFVDRPRLLDKQEHIALERPATSQLGSVRFRGQQGLYHDLKQIQSRQSRGF